MSEVETAGTGADQPAGVAQRSVTICNKRGLHARAAARFVKLAWQFDAEVTVRKNGTTVSGRSIITAIELAATGREAERAVAALADLVAGGFDEG